VRPDIVASYKITVENLDRFDPSYLVEDAKMIHGVRDAAIIDLVEPNAFVLDVRFHGQTEQTVAERIATRILSQLERDVNLPEVDYDGILGSEDPRPGVAWTGRDSFDEITSRHEGHTWVRADYFVHALSHEDLGIRDVNYEHMVLEALKRWNHQGPAREAIRRMREMYALVPQIRELADMPVEIEETIVDGGALAEANAVVEEPLASAVPE
jgi:hypothetical protein